MCVLNYSLGLCFNIIVQMNESFELKTGHLCQFYSHFLFVIIKGLNPETVIQEFNPEIELHPCNKTVRDMPWYIYICQAISFKNACFFR